MTALAACTIVAHNYLPLARILARSYTQHHPEATFYIVVVDRPLETRTLKNELCEIIPVTDIDFGVEGFAHMATIYDVTEFATAVKPFALRHLLQTHECVMYIDPDIKLFARLDPLVESTMDAGWSVTPHCLEPIVRNGWGPTEREIMEAGIYNLGYVGVTRKSLDFVNWWAERLKRDAIIDPSRHLFTDQRWVDVAVAIFSPHIERSPAYNVAYWNLDQRKLWRDGSTLMVDDEVLRFFHFSGYSPEKPHWLSRYQVGRPRVLLSDQPVLAELCSAYGEELLAMRDPEEKIASYGWAQAFPGFTMSHAIRRTFRDELLQAERDNEDWPPSPFSDGGADKFRQWLCEVPEKCNRGLPRYLSAIYDARHDLQGHFPEVNQGRLVRFKDWLRDLGRVEYPELSLLGHELEKKLATRGLVHDERRDHDGIDLVGYLNTESGVGEAGRLVVTALHAADVTVSTIACTQTVSRQKHNFVATGLAHHDKIIMAINADQFGEVRHTFGPQFFERRYVIGQWFWEIEEFPKEFANRFGMLHEIWAATKHIQNMLIAAAPETVKVHHMPLPLVAPPTVSGVNKKTFGLDDRFTFLFTFDFMSVFERKNPMGVVKAFTKAFAHNEGPILVLKTINGHHKLEDIEKLRWACRSRSDIVIMDEFLETDMAGSLIAACDCYVSLHRAEGLGLTMSEAMTLGKPVIATAYSGNLDFMTPDTAVLIPWTRVKVGPNAAPYSPTATWAEPDTDAAAIAMRRVFEDKEFAAQLGAAAKADLEMRFSPEVTGLRMKNHLHSIRRS